MTMNTHRATPLLIVTAALALAAPALSAAEFHVATNGNDSNSGRQDAPFRTIQRAADLAQPGDTITVHAGVYRERITPPRGGESDAKRIVYQAAPGEQVEIRGSEAIKNWEKVQEDVWKVTLHNSFFGSYNPYRDLIRGDWFNPKGREHHTGAVYLNGAWLVEAAALDEVLAPGGTPPRWLTGASQQYLLNVVWLRPRGSTAGHTPAASFAAHHGVQTAPATEGGECIGWIDDGDWVRYERVDLGPSADQIEIRAASATEGGVIEIRLDSPDGALLGSVFVPNTGGWQSWASFDAKIQPTGGVKTLCLVFKDKVRESDGKAVPQLWYGRVEGPNTTIWAQFKGVNPNEELVEINARPTVFYPDKPGRNYITVRGFALRHAATQWAPPTAEQVGLIGTHWSKGWIIESNVVSHSVCSGVALGKYGDQWDNTSADTAEGYVLTIQRALDNGWHKDSIGHHIVRNNTISHCEQAGIVGSLGAAFCTVTGNTIHDIHVRRLFTGAEMAGIKFHAAIDTVLRGNHIYRTCLGLWLDWMAQGTRVSGNRFHDNSTDLFVEVNHGPFVVDNNLFLSGVNLLDMSEGAAFAHNLFTGTLISRPEPNRETPYHPAHTTKVAGLTTIKGGDHRFYNNIFVRGGNAPDGQDSGYGLWVYDKREYPLQTGGNLYYQGARPYATEANPTTAASLEPGVLKAVDTTLVTTERLGKAKVPNLPYENADGSPLKIDTDHSGEKRSQDNPTPGPFENPRGGQLTR